MPWQVGIDEAGYGPNLGPLLQTSIGVRFPDEPTDLWQVLASTVRRCADRRDSRITVDDSKKLFGPGRNLANLELSVLAAICPPDVCLPMTVGQLLSMVAPGSLPEVRLEPWYLDSEPIPVAAEIDSVRRCSERWHAAARSISISTCWIRSRVTPPARFNSFLDERDNKAEILTTGLRWLIREARQLDDQSDRIEFAVDRLGGRFYHLELLQTVCPDGDIEVVEENEAQCRYQMHHPRPLSWSFEVDADARHFTVALASMVSKYIRELLMGQFNRFWQTHVPGIKPTAGYPTDAARFIEEIRPAMRRLQIEERIVWRRK
jgi:ribonuclease HII